MLESKAAESLESLNNVFSESEDEVVVAGDKRKRLNRDVVHAEDY